MAGIADLLFTGGENARRRQVVADATAKGLKEGGIAGGIGLGVRSAAGEAATAIKPAIDAVSAAADYTPPGMLASVVPNAVRAAVTGTVTPTNRQPSASAAAPAAAKPAEMAPSIATVPQAQAQPTKPAPVPQPAINNPAPGGNGAVTTIIMPREQPKAAPVDHQGIASQMFNDGTWSGMWNAGRYLKQVNADRAASIAEQNAATADYGAKTGRIAAESNNLAQQQASMRADRELGARQSVMAEQAKAAQYENAKRAEVDTLRTQYLAEKDPAKKRALEEQLIVMGGKEPRQNKFQIVTQEEPLDPNNPALGTKKTPYIVDEQGNSRPAVKTGIGAAPKPSLDEFKKAISADPRAKNFTEQQIADYYKQNYGA